MATAPIEMMTTDHRAREYELIYILKGTCTASAAEKVAERVNDVVQAQKGKLLRVDNWGRRRLAYPIAKSSRGVFIYLRLVGWNDLIAELERNLRLLDEVVRFQTVLINDRVDPEAYDIDPAEVAFGAIEEATEEDEEPGLAQRLGLVERPRPESSYGDDSGDDGDDGAKAAKADGEDDDEDEDAAPAKESEKADKAAQSAAEKTSEEPS